MAYLSPVLNESSYTEDGKPLSDEDKPAWLSTTVDATAQRLIYSSLMLHRRLALLKAFLVPSLFICVCERCNDT